MIIFALVSSSFLHSLAKVDNMNPIDVSRDLQFLLTSLAFFHAPSRAYLDPWTGDLFGEGGVEKDLHEIQYAATHGDRPKHPVRPPPPVKQSEENVANRPIINESQQELDRMDVDSVSGVEQGGVIMKKLGNATAKCVFVLRCYVLLLMNAESF